MSLEGSPKVTQRLLKGIRRLRKTNFEPSGRFLKDYAKGIQKAHKGTTKFWCKDIPEGYAQGYSKDLQKGSAKAPYNLWKYWKKIHIHPPAWYDKNNKTISAYFSLVKKKWASSMGPLRRYTWLRKAITRNTYLIRGFLGVPWFFLSTWREGRITVVKAWGFTNKKGPHSPRKLVLTKVTQVTSVGKHGLPWHYSMTRTGHPHVNCLDTTKGNQDRTFTCRLPWHHKPTRTNNHICQLRFLLWIMISLRIHLTQKNWSNKGQRVTSHVNKVLYKGWSLQIYWSISVLWLIG